MKKALLVVLFLFSSTIYASAAPCFLVNWAVSKYGAAKVFSYAAKRGYSAAQITDAKKCLVKVPASVAKKPKAVLHG